MTETPARAKLFCLDNFGRWEDKGIGHVSKKQNSIQINSEDTSELMLHFTIEKITAFKQSETIIQWTDKNSNIYALSFQQTESAILFWTFFQEFLCTESLNECTLPEVNEENVEEIVKVLKNEDGRKNISITWVSELCKFVLDSKLYEKFFVVFKELVNLAKFEVFEAILTDKNFVAIFKALDTDPERSFTTGFDKFLENDAKFVNFVGISDEGLIRKIHFAYRILCLKENLMSKSFKEYTFQCLCNFHLVIWNQIVLDMIGLSEVRMEIHSWLRKGELQAFAMISESFQNSRFVSSSTRLLYYTSLKNEGILGTMLKGWTSTGESSIRIKRIIIDTLLTISYVSPTLVIETFRELPEKSYIKILKSSIDLEAEILQKTSELIKSLFTSDCLSQFHSFFLDFYDQIFPFFLSKLNTRYLKSDILDVSIEILQLFSDLLSKDQFSMQVFLISQSQIPVISGLLRHSSKPIKLASIKLIKSLVRTQDTTLQKELFKSRIFFNVFKLFQDNKHQEGMIFSSILSLCKELNSSSDSIRQHVIEVLTSFNLPEISSIFQEACPLPQLNIRRSRGFSFDLTASEVFVDSDKNSPTIECNEVSESLPSPGKRLSETMFEPKKRFDRKSE